MRRKLVFGGVGLVLLLCLAKPFPVLALGIGQCHVGNIYNSPHVAWTYPSGEVLWSKLNPQDGVFDFSNLDAEIEKNKSRGEKIWIQVLADQPYYTKDTQGHCLDVVPRWLKDEGLPVHEWTDNYGQKCIDSVDPWHPLYRQKLQELIYQMHKRYEIDRWPDYQNTLEAVLLMAGGNYGEMVLDGNKKDLLLTWMAQKTGVSKADLAVQRPDGSYVLDDYFALEVQSIADLYAQTFRKLPVVLQIGTGLGYSTNTTKKVTDYLAPRWKNHLWFKFNGWGTDLSVDNNVFKVMQNYADITLNHVEQGHPDQWCGADKASHNAQAVSMALGTSYPFVRSVSACILLQVIQAGASCPIDYSVLSSGLAQNLQTDQSKGLYPVPTLAPAAASKSEIIVHLYRPESQYDLNFDGEVNTLDFSLTH